MRGGVSVRGLDSGIAGGVGAAVGSMWLGSWWAAALGALVFVILWQMVGQGMVNGG